MNLWNRLEQVFKRNGLKIVERMLALTEKTPDEMQTETIRRILVIRQHDQLGDFLLSTPVFRALRHRFPQAHLAVVARKYTADLARHNRYLDEVICFRDTLGDWSLSYARNLLKRLHRQWDLVVVLNTVSHSLSSDLLARLTRAPWIVGSEHLRFPGTMRNFNYHLEAPYHSDLSRHQSKRNVDIVRHIGAETDNYGETMHILESEQASAREVLGQLGWTPDRPLIVIHPGAGKTGNRWPVDRFARVAERLCNAQKIQVFLTWGPDEGELGTAFLEQCQVPVMTYTFSDIRDLAALLSQADLMLCNDTGVMHLAAAVGTPLVAVFGPTDHQQWKPWGEPFIALQGQDQSVSTVTVKDVYQAAQNLLLHSG